MANIKDSRSDPFIDHCFSPLLIAFQNTELSREIRSELRGFRTNSSFGPVVQNLSKFTYFNTGLGEKETVRYTKAGVGRIKGQGDLRVEIKLLDSFNLQNINFIKLDVEGYEEKILNGSKNTILKHKPTVVIEQNKGNFDAKKLIETWGYECVSVFEENNKPHDYLFTFKH